MEGLVKVVIAGTSSNESVEGEGRRGGGLLGEEEGMVEFLGAAEGVD